MERLKNRLQKVPYFLFKLLKILEMVIFFRYASLYFCCAIEQCDNELLTLEIIHRYVELLDKYFGSVSNISKLFIEVCRYSIIHTSNLFHLKVCELDIIFNFEKAYFILDELMLGGEVQETSKKNVLKAIAAQDLLQEVSHGNVDL